MQSAAPPAADRLRGQHLALKGRGASLTSPVLGEVKGGDHSSRICLGVITGAHGVKGRVRLKSFTAEPQAIASYGPLSDEHGAQRFVLTVTGEAKSVLLAQIEGVDDRDAAEALRGTRLFVERAALPPPEAEEFYQADLVGLEAVLRDGRKLGRVTAVHDFGAGASLEIEESGGKIVILPFTTAAVPEIDIAAGHVIVAPPKGLDETPQRDDEA